MNWKALLIVLGIVVGVPMAGVIATGLFQNWYNSGIDYSCNVDSDCVIKSAGCHPFGIKSACVNENSKEGLCLFKPQNECAFKPMANCVCKEKRCI